MKTNIDNFQNGVVFRICFSCFRIVGCWSFGEEGNCHDCGKKCLFKLKKTTEEGFHFYSGIDTATTSMCSPCYVEATETIMASQVS